MSISMFVRCFIKEQQPAPSRNGLHWQWMTPAILLLHSRLETQYLASKRTSSQSSWILVLEQPRHVRGNSYNCFKWQFLPDPSRSSNIAMHNSHGFSLPPIFVAGDFPATAPATPCWSLVDSPRSPVSSRWRQASSFESQAAMDSMESAQAITGHHYDMTAFMEISYRDTPIAGWLKNGKSH